MLAFLGAAMNRLYYGDNLDILRDHIASESVDLIYLDPPFNSNATYNVLFKAPGGGSGAPAPGEHIAVGVIGERLPGDRGDRMRPRGGRRGIAIGADVGRREDVAVDLSAPVMGRPHRLRRAATDGRCENPSESILAEAHRLTRDIDAALVQRVLAVP
jgi:hypothetical protein